MKYYHCSSSFLTALYVYREQETKAMLLVAEGGSKRSCHRPDIQAVPRTARRHGEVINTGL